MGKLSPQKGLHPSEEALICTSPFRWFEVHGNGKVFLCCPAWLGKPVGNLFQQSVEEIWNSDAARMIRRSVLDGSFRHCNAGRCPNLSTKNGSVTKLADLAEGEVRTAITDGQDLLPYGPRDLNLCHDRSCNLACLSCRDEHYHADTREQKRAETLNRKILQGAAPSVETIKVSGTGDPFGSSSYRNMLRNFCPEDFPKLKNIHLHTNAQLWDQEMWESMMGIHPFVQTAEISVDAARAETYEGNRLGGDFKKLLANFDYLSRLPIRIKISFVVQANNFLEMPAFADLGAKYGFDVYFSQIVNWGTFSGEELRKRAVHLPEHPDHSRLLGILGELVPLGHVDLGNLTPLLKN